MTVKIKIIGTEQDAKLLKKAIKQYADNTKKKMEKYECESFIRLIEYAEKEAMNEAGIKQ